MIGVLQRFVPLFAAALLIISLVSSVDVRADEFNPALLQIVEDDNGLVNVTWKVPVRGNRILALEPILPEFLQPIGSGSIRHTQNASVEFASYSSKGKSLAGAVISIGRLESVSTDVLVRVTLMDGSTHSTILRSGNVSYKIPEQVTKSDLAITYWKMGTVHILEGYDHLLFLTALMLIVAGIWPLIKTVTAFTLAHSVTLALSTLDIIHVPSVPTEAVISLSIVLLSVEVMRKSAGEHTLSERYPWLVAFVFGLVHGLGFAGALSEIGVPVQEVALTLLMFNVGVETGQLLFVAAISMLLVGLQHLSAKTALTAVRTAPYWIGGIGAFWTIERVLKFL